MPKKYSKSELDSACEMLKTHYYREVTEATGICKSTLYLEAKRRGINIRKQVYTVEQLEIAMEMLKTHTIAETMIVTGVSRTKLITEKAKRKKAAEEAVKK